MNSFTKERGLAVSGASSTQVNSIFLCVLVCRNPDEQEAYDKCPLSREAWKPQVSDRKLVVEWEEELRQKQKVSFD